MVAHFHLKMFTFAPCLYASRVGSSGKPHGRVFTSKMAKFVVFSVYRAPPAERARNHVFACNNTKFAGFSIFTYLLRKVQKATCPRTLNVSFFAFLPFLGPKNHMVVYLY